jgi:hypothetical protein
MTPADALLEIGGLKATQEILVPIE